LASSTSINASVGSCKAGGLSIGIDHGCFGLPMLMEREMMVIIYFVARLHHRGFLQELLQESERAVECSTALSDGSSST
jgi:hypothetical protein